ncbi:hypothetical protein GCM10027098_03200 [Bowmanella dokdonensis]
MTPLGGKMTPALRVEAKVPSFGVAPNLFRWLNGVTRPLIERILALNKDQYERQTCPGNTAQFT